MKWFRHMSNASEDEFLSELEDIFGLEGYARWWKLLEIIAKQMDATDKCWAEYSWVKWQSFLKGKRNKLETFLEHSQNKRKIKLEQTGNNLKIICPKLLELRDEYSRKSAHYPDMTPDKVAPDTEEEEEEERKKERKSYRFAASVIKLSEKDYLQMKTTFSAIPDFDAELRAADSQYAREPPGNWFCALGNRLNAKHQAFLKKSNESQREKPKEIRAKAIVR